MRSAFVSHSTSDDRYVAEMESDLRAAGFDDVFNDVSAIRPDEKFWPEIEKGIAKCEALVVVITFASSGSEWVKREVEYARGLSKKIIPVWIEDCPIPAMFADRDVIDFRPRTRQERRFEISRIDKYAPAELIGREDETKLLNDAWEKVLRLEKGRPHVLTFVALGGEGKTSLVAKWAAELAHQDWLGCDAAFAWSFYSQGTREQVAASSDLFLKEALTFLGDDADRQFAASSAGAFEKAQRLARVVGKRRSLLILDGLEPLQYSSAATAFKPGELKDQGVAKLLRDLASASHGLCIVTTRIELPDLQAFKGGAVHEIHLNRLSRDAGVHLLQQLGVRKESGSRAEFEKLIQDVKGHALTLTLLGGFLKRAFHGDIRQRDRVKFEKADEKMDGGHAFRTMAAYEQWLLRDGGDEGRREVTVLRLMGLFDRPADAGCLSALRRETIPGLTEPLAGLADDDWEYCLSGLEDAKLLTVNRDASGALVSLDAHPHLREYFARQLRTQRPDAWRAAHRRLYEHLCATTKEGDQPTLEELQPLYQAVAHGCQAGLQQAACDDVYFERIMRGALYYSSYRLGAFGSNLGAIACFFEQPWSLIMPGFDDFEEGWLLALASFDLRALGRLNEAFKPTQSVVEIMVRLGKWHTAATDAGNLSDFELTLGDVTSAISDAERSITYADRSGAEHERVNQRSKHAVALHVAGRRAEAEARFLEAERMQQEMQPNYRLLVSVAGFWFGDLLLTEAERAAWQTILGRDGHLGRPQSSQRDDITMGRAESPLPAGESSETQRREAEFVPYVESCSAVSQRATTTLDIVQKGSRHLLSIAVSQLTLSRASLYAAILNYSDFRLPNFDFSEINTAVTSLRHAAHNEFIVPGLLTRAWLRFLSGARTGSESAQEDLDEAEEIAERGPMRLHMADIHLYRARLFGRKRGVISGQSSVISDENYPWESPAVDLAAAEKLINDCGYHRRDEELADAKAVLLAT